MWPELDYLIVDLPPGTGDIQLTLVQTVPVTGAVLVTTPQEVAVADAIKAGSMFGLESIDVPILGVVENMSWFTPEELPNNKYFIFGQGGGQKLADQTNSVLLGQIPLVQSVREGGDKGEPASAVSGTSWSSELEGIAERLVEQVRLRNERRKPTQIVQITT